jgi:F-type H+-transporting ATPase subunit delta
VRQRIRGYTDAVIQQTSDIGDLAQAATDLAGVVALVDGSQDLRRVLADPGIPVPARRAVLTDLLQDRVTRPALRLIAYALEADRATDFRDDLAWLAARIDAAAQNLTPVGDVVLGRRGAAERVDGYADGVLEQVTDRGPLDDIEDELFRFMRIVDGSPELVGALTDRDVPAVMRRSLVADLLQGKATSATVQLAAYATQVGRPRDYQELLAHLVDRVAAESNRRLAEVRVPVDLDDERRHHLADALSLVAGHPVEVRLSLDPSVLGGFVATMGDTVVDGSVRHRLELLKDRLATPEAEITIGDQS